MFKCILACVLKDQITDIFVKDDDFYKDFDQLIHKLKPETLQEGKKRRNRSSLLFDYENIVIMIGFHLEVHKILNSSTTGLLVDIGGIYFLRERCLGKCTTICFMI